MSIDIRPAFRTGDDFDDESIPSVNMSNGTAAIVLGALGWTAEQIELIASEGIDITPLDMTSRVMLSGLFPEMIQPTETKREGNWITFGVDSDRIQRALEGIKNVTRWADQQGREVSIY